jgi:hypothetical protein
VNLTWRDGVDMADCQDRRQIKTSNNASVYKDIETALSGRQWRWNLGCSIVIIHQREVEVARWVECNGERDISAQDVPAGGRALEESKKVMPVKGV